MANDKVNRKLNGEEKEEEEEPKIPVFTVLKNGAILKNIFIVNKSPPPPHSKPISTVLRKTHEEILIVGRHPDCNIVLTHPSISRFHLQILSDPFSQKLSLTDLSSVHGTWVSDKKIEPGVRVELSEGDTLRLGGSSRVYSLHWIPLRQAYDFETPFVPFIAHGDDENAEQVLDQSEISLPVENKETESPDSNSVGVESLFSDETVGVIGKMEVPSAPPLPENAVYSIFDQGEEGGENLSKGSGAENEVSSFWAFGTESVNLFLEMEESNPNRMENQRLQPHCVTEEVFERENPESSFFTADEGEACPAVQVSEKSEKQSQLGKDHRKTNFLSSPLLTGEILEETKTQLDEKENLTPESKPNLPANLNAERSSGEKEEADPAAQVPEKNQSSLRKDQGQFDILFLCSGPRVMENSTLPTVEVLGEDKDEQVPEQSLTPEPKSNLLISQKFEHFDEKEKEAHAAASAPGKIENQRPLRKDNGQTDISCLFSGPLVMDNLPLPIGEVIRETKDQKVVEESLTLEPKSNLPVNLNFEHSDEKECLVDANCGELENNSVVPEDHVKRDTSFSSAPLVTESGNSSMSELIDDKERQTPQSLFTAGGQPESELCERPPLRSENKSSMMMGSIWARRGKPASAVRLQTDKSRGKPTEAAYDDDIEQEEEIFTPDKENFTPNTLRLRSLKKKGKIEVKHSKSSTTSSSKLTLVSNIHQQELIESPGKENQIIKELQETKLAGNTSGNQARVEKKLMVTKVRRERIPFPFQSIKSSGGKNISEDSVPNTGTRSSSSFSYTQNKVTNACSNKSVGEGKRSWTMVADATTVLDKESRKSLQFLQGLKGTQLIIPRMVIRELDCLKQRGSLFRKKTEAELVLEWIKECMVKTNWWIHVQSSMEDGRLIAPTPPASPQSLFSDKSWGFPSRTTGSLTFSRCGSTVDLASPSPEDHILDCALLHKRMKRNDGQLVLLSNDVTLKIKAMEEGLLCETAQEFREGLVNPLSERFMWPDSSPCGRTWSYLGNGSLREKYNSSGPLKKSSKGEGAKGLKLILHHNAHYGQIR